MSICRHLRLLLWKNMKIKVRQPVTLAAELLVPLLCALLLVILRSNVKVKIVDDPVVYRPAEMNFPDYFYQAHSLIFYSPATNSTSLLMDLFKKTFMKEFKGMGLLRMRAFPSGVEDIPRRMKSESASLLIEFRDMNGEALDGQAIPANIQYILHPRVEAFHLHTAETYPYPPYNWPPCGDDDPLGLSGVQYIMGLSLARYWTVQEKRDPWMKTFGLQTQCLPFPPYEEDPMVMILITTYSSYLITSFLISAVMFTKAIVFEKEFKLKETLKLVGVNHSIYWISWLISFSLYFVPVLAGYTVLMTVAFTPDSWPVMGKVDPSLFFAFLLCYGLAIITFSFMVSTFVDKGTQAAPVAGILFFAFLAPYQLLATDITSTSRAVKMMCSLSFNVALTLGVDIVSLAGTVSSGEGSRWSNYHLPAFPEDKLSLKDCMAMLLVDSALHCIITWYLDHVRPGEHGIAKSPWFCFSLSYWFPYEKSSVGDLPRQGSGPNVSVFQPEPTDVEPEVQIINLQKTFGDKQVVKSTNLSMYKDEIFVLIGHNGCGKSITLGMITGFVPPSSGNVIIKGYDIRTNLEAVRKYLGVCPQFNILFQSLTVREHLSLIAQLKGLSGQELANDVHHIAREMGLKQKLDSLASRLCEGHQRQLSVAIALIGNPEVIILDEPTAGMDPAARRNTWHLLKRIRKNRTVIMTTHFMDEADLLGDRIAMMQNGEVKCCGTSAFLKDVYGLGYHLVITIGPICNISDLAEAIMNHVETAQFESVLGNTATFTLPFEETPKFPGLFLELNSKMDELNIFNFGISTPSIEEVFLEVVGQNEDVMSLAYSGSLVIPGHSCVARLSEARSIRAMTATSLHHATSDINKAKLGDPQSHELVLQDSKPSQNTLNAVVEFCKQMQGQVASETDLEAVVPREKGARRLWSIVKALLVKKFLFIWSNIYLLVPQLLLPIPIIIAMTYVESHDKMPVLQEQPLTYDLAGFKKLRVPYTSGRGALPRDEKLAAVYAQELTSAGSKVQLQKLDLNWEPGFGDFILTEMRERGLTEVLFHTVMGLEVRPDSTAEAVSAIAHYNAYPLHARHIGMNYVVNTMLKYLLNETFSLQAKVAPLPKELDQNMKHSVYGIHIIGSDIATGVAVAMSFTTIFMFHFLILENQVGAKQLQVVSGANPLAFWCTTFVVDYLVYCIGGAMTLLAFVLVSEEAYFGPDGNWRFLLPALVTYGWAHLALLYALHRLFVCPSTGTVFNFMFNIMSSMIPIKILLMMDIMYFFGLASLNSSAEVIDMICALLFPMYSLSASFKQVFVNYHNLLICPRKSCAGVYSPCCKDTCDRYICIPTQQNYLSFEAPGIGYYIVCMVLQGNIFFAIALLMDYHVPDRLWYLFSRCLMGRAVPKQEDILGLDSDVVNERRRILKKPTNYYLSKDPTDEARDVLSLVNLYRCYGTLIAVDHLCLGVPKGECFVLLGYNGAGKTSIFNMITGSLLVTEGNAYVMGHSVVEDIANVQARIGYCPQSGGLLLHMTCRQTLTMYARLRGVKEGLIQDRIQKIMKLLLLDDLADVPAVTYSGGNRRKLTAAISLLDDSPLLLLDEPSFGMDPMARRQLWEILTLRRQQGTTMILASHRITEWESLATRVGVLVNGQLACLGTPDHLKKKFGQGFTFIVHLCLQESDPAPIESLIENILSTVEGCQLLEQQENFLHFIAPECADKLHIIFLLLEEAKESKIIQDYSLQLTDLENVYLSFTSRQTAPVEDTSRDIVSSIRKSIQFI